MADMEQNISKKPVRSFVVCDAQTISYDVVGQGRPLLLLHGWGSQASVMHRLAVDLSDRYTCYIPDLPGFGESPVPARPWSVDDYVDLVVAFVKQVAGKPTDVIAHSFGGRILLKWAARPEEQQWLGKMAITGGAGLKPKRTFRFYLRKTIASLLKAPFWLLPACYRHRALAWLRTTRAWKSLGSADYQAASGVMRQIFVKTISEYLEPCLPRIHREILLVWGREDTAVPLEQAQRMEAGLKQGTLVVMDHAGHYAFLDQPVTFARIMRSYFTG